MNLIIRPRKYNKRGRKPGYRSETTKDDNAICEVCYIHFHFHFYKYIFTFFANLVKRDFMSPTTTQRFFTICKFATTFCNPSRSMGYKSRHVHFHKMTKKAIFQAFMTFMTFNCVLQVCGAKAGRHLYYGGDVCPSCRAFFRR